MMYLYRGIENLAKQELSKRDIDGLINIQDIEEEWEPDMDDFGTCDVADTY